jgi:hypothetical protein
MKISRALGVPLVSVNLLTFLRNPVQLSVLYVGGIRARHSLQRAIS